MHIHVGNTLKELMPIERKYITAISYFYGASFIRDAINVTVPSAHFADAVTGNQIRVITCNGGGTR